MNAIRLFNEHQIDFLVNSSFTKRNQEEAPKIYNLVKDRWSATAWYLFMIVPTGRGEEIMGELIPAEEYEDMLNWHYDMEKEEDDLLVRPTCAPQYYRIVLQRSKVEGERFKRRTPQVFHRRLQGMPGRTVDLSHRCRRQCAALQLFPHGGWQPARASPFKDIWENSKLMLELRNFDGYKDNCGRCEYVNVCGGCRARAYAMTGDYLADEPFCTYQPRR